MKALKKPEIEKMFGISFFLKLLICLLVGTEIVVAEDDKLIGSFYQCAHGLKGKVFVENERKIIIKDFHYDGQGPAAWFHAMLKGAEAVTTDVNFKTLPYPNATCERLEKGKPYRGEEVTLIFPVSIKEFETIGVFCYEFCHNFGHVIIPADLEVPATPADLMTVNECPMPSYPPCTKQQTDTPAKQGQIKPNCQTGEVETRATKAPGAGVVIVPSVLPFLSFSLAISMTFRI